MEACATSHHWARTARGYGHRPRLLHPQYVKPYVRRNKTDAADADALLRAAGDPDLKPVPVKSLDHQALQGLHRIRSQWQDTRRQRICLARALLAEFGVHLPTGAARIVAKLMGVLEHRRCWRPLWQSLRNQTSVRTPAQFSPAGSMPLRPRIR